MINIITTTLSGCKITDFLMMRIKQASHQQDNAVTSIFLEFSKRLKINIYFCSVTGSSNLHA